MITLFIDGYPVCSDEQFEMAKEVIPFYDRFYIRGVDDRGHLMFTCKYLGDDLKCGDYANRPWICRNYPSEEIFRWGGKLVSRCGYKFIPVEDFGKILDDRFCKNEKENQEENDECGNNKDMETNSPEISPLHDE